MPASRVVLVGFMGAGKTSVGRRLAGRLGWRFVDVDEAVERAAGVSVPEIFRRHGEARFRALEERTAAGIFEEDLVVVATGGGWGAHPGRLDTLPPGTVSVWLEVGAAEAVRRAAGRPGRRPLLDVDDPLEAARDLLRRRAPHYARATLRVDTEGHSVDDVTATILRILEEKGTRTDAP